MINFDSIEDILHFAIAKEIASYAFYMDMAETLDSRSAKVMFEELAEVELTHKEQLELELIKRGVVVPEPDAAEQEDVSRKVIDRDWPTDFTCKQAIKLALQKEKAAWRMYVDLIRLAENEEAIKVFMELAEQEIRHKLILESEYTRCRETG
jgi:rubrerythrin